MWCHHFAKIPSYQYFNMMLPQPSNKWLILSSFFQPNVSRIYGQVILGVKVGNSSLIFQESSTQFLLLKSMKIYWLLTVSSFFKIVFHCSHKHSFSQLFLLTFWVFILLPIVWKNQCFLYLCFVSSGRVNQSLLFNQGGKQKLE